MFHPLTICQEIANRMADPVHVCNYIEENIAPDQFPNGAWLKNTFADGLPGIACFYGAMERAFPNEGWEKVAYKYLQMTASEVEQNSHDKTSLFYGLCGLCFAFNFCSDRGTRYQNILRKLEDVLAQEIQSSFLDKVRPYERQYLDLPSNLYNLADGLSGFLAYLLMRKDNDHLYKIAVDVARTLIQLFGQLDEEGKPRWYVSPQFQLNDEEGKKYPEGSFSLNMPFGITGCLASLSLASLKGLDVKGLKETINFIATWVKEQKKIIDNQLYWPNAVPFLSQATTAQEKRTSTITEFHHDTWWHGIPAVARSLYLASKALCDQKLEKFAEDAFIAMFSKSYQDWNHVGTSLAHGKAGILTAVYRMAESTENPFFWKQVQILEQDLIGFYTPNSAFGFQMLGIDEKEQYRGVDHPGLLYGAAGVGLSLLLVEKREDLNWDRAFLVN